MARTSTRTSPKSNSRKSRNPPPPPAVAESDRSAIPRERLEAAIAATQALLGFERPADQQLRHWFRAQPQLGGRDRAFIADAAFGVIRHLRRLEFSTSTRKPRALVLEYLLRIAGVSPQLLKLAVPHNDLMGLTQAMPRAPEQPAILLSLPDWLFEKLLAQYGEGDAKLMAQALLSPAPLDLRVNTIKCSRDHALAQLRAQELDVEATTLSPHGLRCAQKSGLERNPLFRDGSVEVQDEGSQLVTELVAPKRNQMVVDFCAGAGGKTLALGAIMQSHGRVYAFDTSEKRLNNLKPRLKRSGLSNVHPQRIDSEHDVRVKRLAGKIDRVLVDAPCSGMGTLRRNPDLKWRMTPEAINELQAKQTSILQAASALVKPGGRLVYATCSLLTEENEFIVEAFLQTHPEWSLIDAAAVLRERHIDITMSDHYLRLFPHTHDTDGFFAAAIEKHA